MTRRISISLACMFGTLACGDPGGRSDADTGIATLDTGNDDVDSGNGSESSSESGTLLDLGMGESSTGEECVAQSIEPEVGKAPVDVILVIDTSPSMDPASSSVEANINQNFAQIMANSGLDYRVIALAGYGGGSSLCVGPPLGGADCANPPALPANTANFFHYDRSTGSGVFLESIIAWYTMPDPHGLAPGGWSDWVRPEAAKVIVGITDSTSQDANDPSKGDLFDMQLLALDPGQFGSAQDRNYTFHTINGLPAKPMPTDPWLAQEPLQFGACQGYAGGVAAGPEMQQVSILSGGLRFPMCQFAAFDVVFNAIAQGVIVNTPLACSFEIPAPPDPNQTIDPDTIQVVYTPGQGAPIVFTQVAGLAECTATGFYIEANTVVLCPEACAVIQGDPDAKLDLEFGCDVGFE